METRKKRNGLYVELPDDLHRQIRAYAAMRGVTLRDLVLEGLQEKLTAEELENALHKLYDPGHLATSTGAK